MIPLSFDFETALIRPGLLAPPAVCVTWKRPGLDARIATWSDQGPRLKAWLEDPTQVLVGANVAYDMGVICANYPSLLPLVFKAYDEDRVTDIQIRQKLLDIASGCYRGRMVQDGTDWKYEAIKYSLFDCTRRLSGRVLKKDGFRLFYQFFRDTPLDRWVERARYLQSPEGAESIKGIITLEQVKELPGFLAADPNEVVSYPLEDAVATEECFLAQETHSKFLADQYRQTRAAWWLHLMSAWGIHTDPTAVGVLREKTQGLFQEVHARLVEAKLVRPDGSRDTKAAKLLMESVCKAQNRPMVKTPAGQVCLDADACEATEDPVLEDYAEYSTLSKVMSNDLEMLQKGVHVPVQSRFDLAETGRTTSSGPNIQNLRRMPGIRECFRPRAGKVFVGADYDQLELRTLARACLAFTGRSTLADVLNEGQDPHTAMACTILGISYEEASARRKMGDKVVDAARQTAKVANFGFPGGLGPVRLCHFAKKSYNVDLTEERAEELKEQWYAQWPEMFDYFWHVRTNLPSPITNKLESLFPGHSRKILALRKHSVGVAKSKQGSRAVLDPIVRQYFSENGLPSAQASLAVDRITEHKGDYFLEQLHTKRFRGGTPYTAACNTFFQGLGADVTKDVGWRIAQACYSQQDSPLFGARLVLYIHDEFLLECEEARCHEVAVELVRLMTEDRHGWMAPVKLTTEALASRYYSKDAKPVYREGRLVPWPSP